MRILHGNDLIAVSGVGSSLHKTAFSLDNERSHGIIVVCIRKANVYHNYDNKNR